MSEATERWVEPKGATTSATGAMTSVAGEQRDPRASADASSGAGGKLVPALSAAERLHLAQTMVQTHTLLSAGTGLIPAPGIDVLANWAVQLTLLSRLSKLYGVPYSRNLGKAKLIAFASSLGSIGAARAIGASLTKVTPVFGTLAGSLSAPATFGAFTFAVGKVFTQHFESGGTFLDFRASAYRDYFREMFGLGEALVRKQKAAPTPAAGGSA